MEPTTHEITRALAEIGGDGRPEAAEALLPLIYDELRRIAADALRRERADHTLQPTALVHEAYLRLLGGEPVTWQSRSHFFALAATAIRRVLIDHGRQHRAQKRGGRWQRVLIDADAEDAAYDLVDLDDALRRLAELDERKSRVVELRYFGGLDIEQTGEVLGVSHATVQRDWAMARAWLYRELTGAEDDS